ncbi:hypothetical protein [Streptomyces sp. NBC_01643]|uniref:hypothetical protein n=1 Tax=Streptomyces sp. NBC_01643 TaxID=2975906 RepID=UPI002F90DCA2|nr:hypothetical protein OHB03_47680 [Streptomyces sp. NBC_01643]
MSLLTITRFNVGALDVPELLVRHRALVCAAKAITPSLTGAQLGRLDDTAWVSFWWWTSSMEAHSFRENAPGLPEARDAFALAKNVTVEEVHLVDASD